LTVVTETYTLFIKYRFNSHYNLHRIYYSLIVYTNVVYIDRQAGRRAGGRVSGGADGQAVRERKVYYLKALQVSQFIQCSWVHAL
jgi:hypothetical protein